MEFSKGSQGLDCCIIWFLIIHRMSQSRGNLLEKELQWKEEKGDATHPFAVYCCISHTLSAQKSRHALIPKPNALWCSCSLLSEKKKHWHKFIYKQAGKPQSYASLKVQPNNFMSDRGEV